MNWADWVAVLLIFGSVVLDVAIVFSRADKARWYWQLAWIMPVSGFVLVMIRGT